MIEALFFYMFAAVMLGAGLMVVVSRNPVFSVLFLILAFFNAAGLFVLIGAEFIAMLLVVVYVGAVAVLFLFVVMMLDINFAELRAGFQKYLPLGLAVGGILVFELVTVMYGDAFSNGSVPIASEIANTTQTISRQRRQTHATTRAPQRGWAATPTRRETYTQYGGSATFARNDHLLKGTTLAWRPWPGREHRCQLNHY